MLLTVFIGGTDGEVLHTFRPGVSELARGCGETPQARRAAEEVPDVQAVLLACPPEEKEGEGLDALAISMWVALRPGIERENNEDNI